MVKVVPALIQATERYASLHLHMVCLHGLIETGDVPVCTCISRAGCGRSAGKHPRYRNWTETASADLAVVFKWFKYHPNSNIGIATGATSGIVVIDIDPGSGGNDSLQALEQKYGPLPPTWEQNTGGGGRHLVFSSPGVKIANTQNNDLGKRLGPGVDVRGDGGQFVAWPSLHASGRQYTWQKAPWEMTLAGMPHWLVDLLQRPAESTRRASGWDGGRTGSTARTGTITPYARKALESELARVTSAPPSSGNDQLNVAAYNLGQLVGGGEMDRATAEHELLMAATPRRPEAEARATIKSGIEAGMANPRSAPHPAPHPAPHHGPTQSPGAVPQRNGTPQVSHQQTADEATLSSQPAAPLYRHTDVGNAKRLVNHFGDSIRYCHPWKKWLVWDGCRWAIDQRGTIEQFAKETVAAMYLEAARLPDDLRAGLVKHALSTEARIARIHAMVDLARSERGATVLPAELDTSQWLLNCTNGTVDLRSGQFRPHQKEDCLTKLCRVAFDPQAECPHWLGFLACVFPGEPTIVSYLQRFLGYCLTGDVREQVMPIFHGGGANGKSTLLNTIYEMLGEDYATKAATEMLMVRSMESHPTERADLFGKRLVIAIETQEGRSINEALIKELTGGDPIKARRMREDFWEFLPTHKIVLATNHQPKVRGTDEGIWRRLPLVPFKVRFWDKQKGEHGPEELRADKDLGSKLRAEFPGILAWCVRGCLEWQASGLEAPNTVREASSMYRNRHDLIGAFLADCCAIGTQHQVGATELYVAYTYWCNEHDETILSQRRFGGAMSERGFQRGRDGLTEYYGLGLKEQSTQSEEPDPLQSL
jgi:putative DNA primase/helicase